MRFILTVIIFFFELTCLAIKGRHFNNTTAFCILSRLEMSRARVGGRRGIVFNITGQSALGCGDVCGPGRRRITSAARSRLGDIPSYSPQTCLLFFRQPLSQRDHVDANLQAEVATFLKRIESILIQVSSTISPIWKITLQSHLTRSFRRRGIISLAL